MSWRTEVKVIPGCKTKPPPGHYGEGSHWPCVCWRFLKLSRRGIKVYSACIFCIRTRPGISSTIGFIRTISFAPVNPFNTTNSQQEVFGYLIDVWEVERVRTRAALLERFAQDLKGIALPRHDDFARYCVKMATGSGKTKVLSLAIAWQFLNAVREQETLASEYAKTFLILAPNVIVLERLKSDFAGGRIFQNDPIVPRELAVFWDVDCVVRDEGERPFSEGAVFLTNIQQFYERQSKASADEPQAMLDVLGNPPSSNSFREAAHFRERIAERAGNLCILNDEAHHTHDEDSEWNNVIRSLGGHASLTAQLDFSATPRFSKGAIFPWTVSDYPLKQAIIDNIVKRPMKGLAHITEAKSQYASVRYKGFLTAAVERWREYRDQLKPLQRKPLLFIMMNETEEADEVADWLRSAYPEDFVGPKTQVIHTDRTGEVSKKELDAARVAVRDADLPDSPINAIVSVLMLREGWDVQNVTVVVGLRPYTSKANILPEQTIGRGLRLMFRDMSLGFTERVDIIGNKNFLDFVDDLEKLEDLKLETFEVGKDKVQINTIMPLENRSDYDIGLPVLTPVLLRKRSLAAEISDLDVLALSSAPLPLSDEDPKAKTFRYEGYDIITLTKEFEREYTLPNPQTSQEVIGYYSRRIAEAVKLPSQFSAIAPKVKEFFEKKAFGQVVDLDDPAVIRAMSTPVAHYVCVDVFSKHLKKLAIDVQEPTLLEPERRLGNCAAIPLVSGGMGRHEDCI